MLVYANVAHFLYIAIKQVENILLVFALFTSIIAKTRN